MFLGLLHVPAEETESREEDEVVLLAYEADRIFTVGGVSRNMAPYAQALRSAAVETDSAGTPRCPHCDVELEVPAVDEPGR
jgi:hypothetical protein